VHLAFTACLKNLFLPFESKGDKIAPSQRGNVASEPATRNSTNDRDGPSNGGSCQLSTYYAINMAYFDKDMIPNFKDILDRLMENKY
jgi:hypothetical protein